MTTPETREIGPDALSIYGASDDLIEVEGTIRAEFDHYSSDEALLAISNGVVLRIVYSASGVWRITLVSKPGSVSVAITQAPEDNDDNYSDRCEVIGGNIAWVVLGTHVAPEVRR